MGSMKGASITVLIRHCDCSAGLISSFAEVDCLTTPMVGIIPVCQSDESNSASSLMQNVNGAL